MRLQTHGVNPTDPGEAMLREVEPDGVFPDGFYSTTNLETVVRLGGHWVPVENPEMDCGIVVDGRPGAHHRGQRRHAPATTRRVRRAAASRSCRCRRSTAAPAASGS